MRFKFLGWDAHAATRVKRSGFTLVYACTSHLTRGLSLSLPFLAAPTRLRPVREFLCIAVLHRLR